MSENSSQANPHLRFQADENPPARLAIGLGVQQAVLCIAGIVITPSIIIRAADLGAGDVETYTAWAAFAAVLISGVCTMVQSARVGRIGAGYVLTMGSSGAFIAVCIAAIDEGGPALMATLVILSSLFQLALAFRLAQFRKVFTPTVCGTVIMLIPVTVMPIVLKELDNVPEGTPEMSAPIVALITLGVIIGIVMAGRGMLRLWAPVIGIVAGTIVSFFLGILDFGKVGEAGWFGIPEFAMPGFDFGFGKAFWTMLPAFVLVTMVGAIETIGDTVAIQKVSWRRTRALDYRAVQGSVAADGLGNMLSGILGTVPNTTYSSCVPVTELTGVASRRVGILCGLCFCLFAFLPKALALVLAIPGPVVGAYLLVLLSILFILGTRIMVQQGLDYRNCLVAGVSFWVGFGFQYDLIYADHVAEFAGGIFRNGMTSGGLCAIVLSLIVVFTGSRRSKLTTRLDTGSIGSIRSFVAGVASRHRWGEDMRSRLEAIGEEAVLTLIEQEGEGSHKRNRHLQLEIHRLQDEVVLDFMAAPGRENLQDRMALLGEPHPGHSLEDEVSVRVLRRLASSVRHQQYHDTDIMSVHVKFPTRPAGGRIA